MSSPMHRERNGIMPDVFVKQGDTGTRLRGGNIRWIVVVCEAGPPEVLALGDR